MSVSKSEKRTLLVAGLILVVSYGVQWWMPHHMDYDRFDYRPADSLFNVLSTDTLVSPRSLKEADKRQTETLTPGSIDVNTATRSELVRLPKVGPVTAQNIINYRRKHGPFPNAESLLKVKRIGPKTLKKIRPYLKFNPTSGN